MRDKLHISGRILILHGVELVLVYLGMLLLPLLGVSLQLSYPLSLKLKTFFERSLKYLFLPRSPSLKLGLQLQLIVVVVSLSPGSCLPLGTNAGLHCYLLSLLLKLTLLTNKERIINRRVLHRVFLMCSGNSLGKG